MFSKEIMRWWMALLVSTVTGGALLLMLHTRGHLIETFFLRWLLAWVPVIILIAFLSRQKQSQAVPKSTTCACILLAFMTLYLFSSSADYTWFYFTSWLPNRSVGLYFLNSQLIQFVLLTALLAPLMIRRPGKAVFWLLLLLIGAQMASVYLFIRETGGAPLYRDDHSSGLFRLWEFCRTFPRLVNYSPFWNGGQISHHPALTGTSAIGFFLLPFLQWLPLEQCYTPMIAVVFIGIVPLLAVLSMRIIGARWPAALCAGLLALGTSQFYFLWLLFYGTLGAVFSAACLMPVSACVFRVMFLDRREKWVGAVLIIAGAFFLMWPPNAVVALGLIIALVVSLLPIWRRLPANLISKPKVLFLMICTAAIIIIQWPQILVITMELLQDSPEHAGAVSASPSIARFFAALGGGYGNLVDYIRMGHPVLIFLGLGGVIAAVLPIVRRWYLPLIIILLFITGWGPEIAPGFQLFRMVIPLFFIAVIPAALTADYILRSPDLRLSLPRAAVASILIVGAINTVMLFGNNLRAPYEIFSGDGHAMTEWIRANTPEGTRVMFAGSTVHGYEGGHVAFLQRMTGREMMACDYYHFSPAVVEYEYPPRPWRKDPEHFNRFLDLYNVSVISTLRDNWKTYLRSRPAEYREGKRFGENGFLTFFKVIRPAPSLFLVGKGRVQANFNRFDVELAGTNTQAVIRYNWQPGLVADPPAVIFPYSAGPDISFIGIHGNGQTNIVIRHKN